MYRELSGYRRRWEYKDIVLSWQARSLFQPENNFVTQKLAFFPRAELDG